MTTFQSVSLVSSGSLQLGASNTAGNQEVGNVVQVVAAGTITGVQYRSGGQSSDPSSLDFNIYKGTTLVATVTGTGMTGANTTHDVTLGTPITTNAGDQYTVTVKMPIHGTLYYIAPPAPVWDDYAGLLYIQGRDQLSFTYGYPNDIAGHFFDVDLIHNVDGLATGALIPTTAFQSFTDCCNAVLAAVRRIFPST